MEEDFNLFKTVYLYVNTIRSQFVTFLYIFPIYKYEYYL